MRINRSKCTIALSRDETRVYYARRLAESSHGTARDEANIPLGVELDRILREAGKALSKERGGQSVEVFVTDGSRRFLAKTIRPGGGGSYNPETFWRILPGLRGTR